MASVALLALGAFLALLPIRADAASGFATTNTVTSSLNPSVNGQSVTFTAAVTGTAAATTATTVYGQGSFTTGTANNGGVSATSLFQPTGTTVDSSGNLYVADFTNNRVLYYPAGSTTATRVYGQGGSFTANTPNNGGISATSLANPAGTTLDSSGNLYIADHTNNRVLYYPSGSTTATRVYGQGGVFTANTPNNGGISATSLANPSGTALDSAGNLYIADYGNNRVLYYPAGSTTATGVYGQGGLFTANTANNGGPSATSLSAPWTTDLDSGGNLYVTDSGNNRVLHYPSGSTTATRVYGQGGSFAATTANNGGISATSLDNIGGTALDSGDNLYITDYGNNRVLYYAAGSTTATRVYGQGGFTTSTANNGGISATSLFQPTGTTVDSSGNVYVSDTGNSRVLDFPGVMPTGTVTFMDGSATLATVALTGAHTASYTTSSLVVGIHSITAVYSGDSNFAATTSSVLAQTVTAASVPVPSTGATSSGSNGLRELALGSALAVLGLLTVVVATRRPRHSLD